MWLVIKKKVAIFPKVCYNSSTHKAHNYRGNNYAETKSQKKPDGI